MTNYPNNLDDASSLPIATSGGGGGGAPDATSTIKGILRLTNDLGGSANAPKVVGLQDNPIDNTTPTDNQILTWISLDSHWSPVSIEDLLPDADSSTKGVLPLSNDLGGTVMFPRVVGIQGRAIQNIEPSDGYVLTWDALNTQWYPAEASSTPPDATDLIKGIIQLTNDLSGTADSPIVVGIGNTPIVGSFNNGNGIIYNNTESEWNLAFVDGYSDLTISAGVESLIGTGSNTFTSIGSIQINVNDFGDSPIFIFEAVFQATAGETAELKLYNITDGLDVSGSLLTTTSNSFEYNSAVVTLSGDKLYEAQFRIDNGSPSPTDGVISGNVKIRVKHRDF